MLIYQVLPKSRTFSYFFFLGFELGKVSFHPSVHVFPCFPNVGPHLLLWFSSQEAEFAGNSVPYIIPSAADFVFSFSCRQAGFVIAPISSKWIIVYQTLL